MGAESSKSNISTEKDDGSSVVKAEENSEQYSHPSLSDIARMDRMIRRKIQGGVHYSMKIILSGMRGTGKSCLWRRFQGLPFSNKYTPTPEIQSATISWHSNEDNVRIEVWDVVDKAYSASKPINGQSKSGKHSIELLDASVVDIYKGTHAVIFMISPLSVESLEYVRLKYKEVPLDISILLVLNFRDRTVNDSNTGREKESLASSDAATDSVKLADVRTLCEEIKAHRGRDEGKLKLPSSSPAGTGDSQENDHSFGVHAFEVSLLNCYGLDIMYLYLELPFLRLKQQSLRMQLKKAEEDIGASHRKLLTAIQDCKYEAFEDKIRKQRAQSVTPAAAETVEAKAEQVDEQVSVSKESVSEEKEEPVSVLSKQQRRRRYTTASPAFDAHPGAEQEATAVSKPLKLSHFSDSPPADWSSAVAAEATSITFNSTSSSGGRGGGGGPTQQKDRRGSPVVATTGEASADMDTFRPAMVADSLDGFLELSDEDERRQRASKERIRALSKKKQGNTKSTLIVEDGEEEDDDDDDYVGAGGGGLSKASPRSKLSRVAPRAKPKLAGNTAVDKETHARLELLPTKQEEQEKRQDSGKLRRKSGASTPVTKGSSSSQPADRISQMVVEPLSPDDSGNDDDFKVRAFLQSTHSSDEEEDGNNFSIAKFRGREVDL